MANSLFKTHVGKISWLLNLQMQVLGGWFPPKLSWIQNKGGVIILDGKKIGEKKLWNSEEKVIAQIENGNIGKKMKILIFAASKYS